MLKLKVFFATKKAKSYWKKSFQEGSRFDLQFRTDFIYKKVKSIMKSLNIEILVKGYENLGQLGPCMLYGNHQDNFDALAIIYALGAQTEAKDDFNKIPTFIAKHTLQYKSYTRYPLNCLDTFFLDRRDVRKSLETYDKYGKFVKDNKTYGVIFPEGTRNREGKISEFKAGAFKVAKKEMMPIVPFTINNSVGAFDKERKETLKIEVIFHKKIPASSFMTQTTVALSERIYSIVNSSFKKPKYSFKDSQEEKNIEESKAAIRFWKKENKKIAKEAKKERKKRESERKILEAQEKEESKYEKALQKKQSKKVDKNK